MPIVIEDIEYDIVWPKFQEGTSFFIPCNNPLAALKIIKGELKSKKFSYVSKVRVEEGVKGVRVWRVPPKKKG